MIKRFTIYGERCSGTNYIEKLILKNFDVKLTWEFGYKHFFGFSNFENSDDVLFIGIIRNPFEWLNSFYKNPWELPAHLIENVDSFLNSEFYSVHNPNPSNIYYKVDKPTECLEDRNIYTGDRYVNVFEMRYTKINFLKNDMPNKVNNFILIRYEDLLDNFENTMNSFLKFGLKYKSNPPVNVFGYKGVSGQKYVKKTYNDISENKIYNHKYFNKRIESEFNYITWNIVKW